MTAQLEYHISVKCPVQRTIPAVLTLLGVLPFLFVSTSRAQVSGAAGSGGGHSSGASVSSGASAGHGTHTGVNPGGTSANHPHPPNGSHVNPRPPHHSGNGQVYYYPYVYGVPVPYSASDAASDDDEDDAEYQGGPTVFDRRGSGSASYVPPVSGPQSGDAAQDPSTADPTPGPPTDPTLLVFKDGHQLEVENYAIVNRTLYDLTPGHPRKIALADIDLPATEKQNDDRGVTFQLPPSAQVN